MEKVKFRRDETSEDDLGIYSVDAREALLDDDEISSFEEAFMDGYDRAM